MSHCDAGRRFVVRQQNAGDLASRIGLQAAPADAAGSTRCTGRRLERLHNAAVRLARSRRSASRTTPTAHESSTVPGRKEVGDRGLERARTRAAEQKHLSSRSKGGAQRFVDAREHRSKLLVAMIDQWTGRRLEHGLARRSRGREGVAVDFVTEYCFDGRGEHPSDGTLGVRRVRRKTRRGGARAA